MTNRPYCDRIFLSELTGDVAMNLFSDVLNISYSKLADIPVPFNTKELYDIACKKGFDAIKGDVTPSSDGKLIMCHDPYFYVDETGRVLEPGSISDKKLMIDEMTAEECIKSEYALKSSYEYLGYHPRVAVLDDLVKICSENNKIPYITVRDKQISLCVDEIYGTLGKYGMENKAVINSFTYDTLKCMREKDSDITLSYVQKLNTVLKKDIIDEAVSLGNCIVCVFWFRKDQQSGNLYEKSQDAICYAKEKGVTLHLAAVEDKEYYKWGITHGFKGFQCSLSDAYKIR